MYNQNIIKFHSEHIEEEPNLSDYILNQEVYNFKEIVINEATVYIFQDSTIIVHHDDEPPRLYASLNKFLTGVLDEVYNRNVDTLENEDLERICIIQEIINTIEKINK